MARAMNVLHYDAVTLGNHEFNYGLPLLNLWIRQLGFPALAANAVSVANRQAGLHAVRDQEGLPRPRRTDPAGRDPGSDQPGRGHLGHGPTSRASCVFHDMVATAAKWVPIMRARGADLVLISAHGGDSGTSSYGPELPNENPSALIAEQVPGIDAILFGHAHNDVPQRFVTNTQTGDAGAALRAVEVGPAADPDGLHAGPRARPLGDHGKKADHAEHQHGDRGPEGAGRGPLPARQDGRVREPGGRARPPRNCPRPSRDTRTRRSWTTSTRCRPTRSPRPWPAPSTRPCRCCRSRRRSAAPRSSRRATSRSRTWPGSTSTTTRSKRWC